MVPLVKAVQELSKMNDEKTAKIDDLQKQLNELKSMIIARDNKTTPDPDQAAFYQEIIPGPAALGFSG